MFPLSEKCFKIVKKIQIQILRVHLDILCARAKFRGKPIIFVSCVKKTIESLMHSSFLHTT
jgi:hypothetical protein